MEESNTQKTVNVGDIVRVSVKGNPAKYMLVIDCSNNCVTGQFLMLENELVQHSYTEIETQHEQGQVNIDLYGK